MRYPPLPGLLLITACGGSVDAADSASANGLPACAHLVVTDIDETLTTSDGEYLAQLADPTHDPALRPQAAELIQAYTDKGYTVFYITARGQDVNLGDGRTGTQAAEDWLIAHGFPYEEGRLYLAPGIGVQGEDAVSYKADVVNELTAAGWTADWGYGNATSDIEAFQKGGIADDHLFLVGELAGTMGVNSITDEEAYAQHIADHVQALDDACP
ncbi:MAG: hypothetical protein GWP91_13485 [Rhodobacterales bacterium]|nr:hypothetical protein [Rhodobacterales bacterium]